MKRDKDSDRRLLNFLPPLDTQNVQPHRAILSEKNPETSPVTSAQWVDNASKWVGKAGTHSHRKSHSQPSAIQLGGNPQLPASARGVKGLDPRLVPQLLSNPLGWVPKTPSSKSQQSLCPWVPQDRSKQKTKNTKHLITTAKQCSVRNESLMIRWSHMPIKNCFLVCYGPVGLMDTSSAGF